MLDRNKFYPWELAALLGLCLALVVSTWAAGTSAALSNQIIRLHVVGASDSARDQAAKLRGRDAVVELATPLLEGVTDREEARAVLIAHLPELAAACGQAAGERASAALEDNVWFPTKHYTDFSLPAGRYTALRLTIGEGRGRNWWCVVFPPLCMGAVTETEARPVGSFSADQLALLTGENEGYVVKFKVLEWWGQLQKEGAGQ